MNNINNFKKENKILNSIEKAKELNEKFNMFSEIFEYKYNLDGELANVPFAIKDNFDLKGNITTSSSLTLKNHKSMITATVVNRLLEAGAVAIGKTNLDEFGMGGTGLASINGYVKNNLDPNRIIGGSSSGSAVAVGLGIVPFALGTDTGDSIRQPAAYNGTVGFKPSWGRVSRYGMHSFSPSFDTTGFITNNVEDQAKLISMVSGYDENDFTCLNEAPLDLVSNLTSNLKGKKIAVFKEGNIIFPKEYMDKLNILLNKLKVKGAEITEISFPENLIKATYPAYQAITFTEGASQMACLDGINFANIKAYGKNLYENISKSRTEQFQKLLKERILIGSNSLYAENQNEVFLKAKKIRRLIINEVDNIFTKFDAYINIASLIAPTIKETNTSTKTVILTNYFMQIANMSGIPSITVPFDKINNLPISVEICSKLFDEQTTLNIALAVEEITKEGKENEL